MACNLQWKHIWKTLILYNRLPKFKFSCCIKQTQTFRNAVTTFDQDTYEHGTNCLYMARVSVRVTMCDKNVDIERNVCSKLRFCMHYCSIAMCDHHATNGKIMNSNIGKKFNITRPSEGKHFPIRVCILNCKLLCHVWDKKDVCCENGVVIIRSTETLWWPCIIQLASSCPSFRPSAWNNSAPTGKVFVKSDIWLFFENLLEKIKFL
jgi:hypothetical protein